MAVSASEAREKLRMVCRDHDPEQVAELLAFQSLNAADSTAALRDVFMDPTAIRILLENGADVSAIHIRDVPDNERTGEILRLLDEYGYNFAAEGHRILEDFARDRGTLDWLLDHGANINLTDHRRLHSGFNLYPGGRDDSLHVLNKVAADGDIDLFDHLVSRGADPLKSIALHSASECQDPDKSRAMVCHLLDKHNMDINSNNNDFRDLFDYLPDTGSPLGNAILHRNLAVVHELILRGAVIDSNSMAYPVGFTVEELGFFPALEPLLRAGADPTKALDCSVRYKNLTAVQMCLDFGADATSALQRALEQEEERKRSIADRVAYYEDNPRTNCKKSELQFKRERLAERDSETMVRMLRYAMGSHTAERTFDRQ